LSQSAQYSPLAGATATRRKADEQNNWGIFHQRGAALAHSIFNYRPLAIPACAGQAAELFIGLAMSP
jgi:hypothetical protein